MKKLAPACLLDPNINFRSACWKCIFMHEIYLCISCKSIAGHMILYHINFNAWNAGMHKYKLIESPILTYLCCFLTCIKMLFCAQYWCHTCVHTATTILPINVWYHAGGCNGATEGQIPRPSAAVGGDDSCWCRAPAQWSSNWGDIQVKHCLYSIG